MRGHRSRMSLRSIRATLFPRGEVNTPPASPCLLSRTAPAALRFTRNLRDGGRCLCRLYVNLLLHVTIRQRSTEDRTFRSAVALARRTDDRSEKGRRSAHARRGDDRRARDSHDQVLRPDDAARGRGDRTESLARRQQAAQPTTQAETQEVAGKSK